MSAMVSRLGSLFVTLGRFLRGPTIGLTDDSIRVVREA